MQLKELIQYVDRNPSPSYILGLAQKVKNSRSAQEYSRNFQDLVKGLAGPLLTISLRYAKKDEFHLEELISNCIERIYKGLDAIIEAKDPLAYAKTTIENTCKNYVRSLKAKYLQTVPIDQISYDMPEETQVNFSLEELIEKMRSCLDERSFFVVTAFYGLGRKPMEPEEIAQILGISYGRVMSIRREAVSKVRELIQQLLATKSVNPS